jgi:hypothetical protein
LSVVCIVKDEEENLEEFVSYYAVLGVDHFFIYDNGSQTPVASTLSRYLDMCTVIDYPKSPGQLQAYQQFIDKHSHLTEWAAFVDIDEFILPKRHATLKEFLQDYKDVDAIGIHWVLFGDSGHAERPDGLVIDNYLKCKRGQHPCIKTVARARKLKSCKSPHYFILRRGSRSVDAKRRGDRRAVQRGEPHDRHHSDQSLLDEIPR